MYTTFLETYITVECWSWCPYYAPPLIGGALSDDFVWRLTSDVSLSDVCLTSVAYIGPKSRTEWPRKTKIGTEVAHVTRDLDTIFKVKRSKVKVTRPLYSPPCYGVRQQQRSAWERTAVFRSARRCEALRRSPREDRGGGILCRHAHSLLLLLLLLLFFDNNDGRQRRI